MNLVINIATLLPFFVLNLLIEGSLLILQVAGMAVNWVLSPEFIGMSYTNPNTNRVIETGLGVTQSLVNMMLILILIYIALATILRLQEYQAQKLLPTFIIIALLVNFTPVICGLIVDASNILMNFFVGQIDVGRFANELSPKITSLGEIFVPTRDWEITKDIALQKIILVPFIAILTFIMFVFALIFMLRYIAIWILVILSPIAFIAYILPITRSWWTMWWKQFINWCFIGITAAFFLYLSLFFVTNIQASIPVPTATTAVTSSEFSGVMPYIVGIVFLGMGLIFGLKSSAIGASTVIRFAQSKGKVVTDTAKKYAWKGTKKTVAGAAAGTAGAITGARSGQGTMGRIGGAIKGAATFEGREKGREGASKILEKMHLVKPGSYEASRRKRWKIEEETKRMEHLPNERLHEIANRKIIRPADKAGSIAAFEVLAKRNSLNNQEAQMLPKMQSFGADIKQALKSRPDQAPLIGKTVQQQVAGTSTGDFTKNTQHEALNAEVIMSLDASKIQHIGLRGTAEQKTALAQAVTANSQVENEIVNRLNQLQAQGNNQEFNRIRDILDRIETNPNIPTP